MMERAFRWMHAEFVQFAEEQSPVYGFGSAGGDESGRFVDEAVVVAGVRVSVACGGKFVGAITGADVAGVGDVAGRGDVLDQRVGLTRQDRDYQWRLIPQRVPVLGAFQFADGQCVLFVAHRCRDCHLRLVQPVLGKVLPAFAEDVLGAELHESVQHVLQGVVVENALRGLDQLPFLVSAAFDNGLARLLLDGQPGDLVGLQIGQVPGTQRKIIARQPLVDVGRDTIDIWFVSAFGEAHGIGDVRRSDQQLGHRIGAGSEQVDGHSRSGESVLVEIGRDIGHELRGGQVGQMTEQSVDFGIFCRHSRRRGDRPRRSGADQRDLLGTVNHVDLAHRVSLRSGAHGRRAGRWLGRQISARRRPIR